GRVPRPTWSWQVRRDEMELFDELTEHTFPALLDLLVERHGSDEAVVAPDGRVTFAELHERTDRMAAWYAAAGLGPGDRVGVLLPNVRRWLEAALGAHRAGVVAVPINTGYRQSEYARVVEGAGVRFGVTADPLFGRPRLDDLAPAGCGRP